MKGSQINYCVPKDDEINSFLDRVDNVTLKIKNLLEGKISVDEIEQEEKRIILEKRAKEIKEEEKKEKEKENFIMGKRGGGDKDNYLYFCKSCLVEFNYKLDFCKRCNNAVISKDERKKELFDKVENYKFLKNKRNERREIWNKYLASSQNKNNKKITSYEKWDYYEPSSDTFDEDEKTLCLPKQDPNFQILEKKIDDDIQKRKEKKQIADRIKLNGNKYFKEKKYIQAIECYNNVIDICKDYLEAYNNLALCYIKTYRYEQAIENCNQIIDYYNLFNSSFSISKDILFKAYFRKGFSFYKLLSFNKALNNFNMAISFNNYDTELLELTNKCKLIVLDQTKYISSNSDAGCVSSFDNIDNIENIFIKLEHVDIIKNEEVFLSELKNVKKVVKKNELDRLKFCSYLYKKKNDKQVSTDKTKHISRGVTFLVFLVQKLKEIMIYINRQIGMDILSKNVTVGDEKWLTTINTSKNCMSKNLIKCCNTIIGIIMAVLNKNYYYSDFCIECVKPILIFYFIRTKFDKLKCAYFLHSISQNANARKHFDEDIFQNYDIALENFFILINNYIQKELETYDEGRKKKYEHVRNKIIESEQISKFNINKEYIISSQNCKNFKKNEKKDKLEKKIIDMCKEKYEIVNLFGILSNLALSPNILNMIEKKFIKYLLNIIIYIIELFYYAEKNVNTYYLSFFINILKSKQIQLLFVNTILDDIFYFISNLQNIDILKSVLTIILNLTMGWNEELAISTASQNKKKIKKKISQNCFKKIITLINSNDKDIRDTAFLLLSRFYLYSYFGHISIEGISTNNEKNTLQNGNPQLKDKLLRENEMAIKLDDHTFSIFINRIYFLFKNKIYLEKACINFVSNLSKYTNFINICLLTKNKNNNEIYNYFYNILEYINYIYSENWKNNEYNMEKDIPIVFNSTLIFFIQLLKKFFITNISNKYEDIIKIIKKNIPYIVTKMDSVEKKINKNISIFLSYCFLTPELKSEVMHVYGNDTNQIHRALIG
ncbi:hypothetical protein YYG_03953 [Plasmodium vinckei petteri]|uniref:Tetratricopeptide repeat protein, putative n=1 Tax=Plasmodium vinckei petteri TaxID=138298 RepID=W7AZB6_PLAVN|nr:hypothetical protein YYG_03953 [Plasmodium vinckei petteri]CAD2097542.1 tetratricopeptide repeat protein, putative [Plasmodium vinckei petteri]